MLSTLYIRLLPPIYQGRMSVPQVRSPIQGTEGCAGATAVRFTPLHAGASACQPKQHGIPLYEASCLSLLWHIPPFIRIFPFRADSGMGKREHIPLCAGRIYFGRSQGGKSPLAVCPADQYFSPAQAVAPVISSFPSAFIPGRAVRTVIIGATLCFLRMLSGSHRSGFTAANIGRRACPLRFEVHFLQILP